MGYISYVRRVIANFVLKVAIFRYQFNRVGFSKFVWHPQMCRLWISPKWCRYLGYIPYKTWVIAIFVLKFANFSLPWQQGSVWEIPTITFKQADPLSSYWVEVWCRIRSSISCISSVLDNFMFENHQLVTMVKRVGLRQISTTPLNCPAPKTPLWCKHLSSIFKNGRVIRP